MLDSAYCLIIPDRNDRSVFTNLLLKRLEKVVTKSQIIHVNYPPKSHGFDLTERVRAGVEQAKGKFEKCYIIENDDYYPLEYFTTFESDFTGYSDTIYYHLRNRTWEKTFHPNHSSLFTTGFSITSLQNFRWPRQDEVFLDIILWKYALTKRGQLKQNSPAIGIKHGIGLCGGMGHRQTFSNKDFDLNWLRSKIDSESFQVYKGIFNGI